MSCYTCQNQMINHHVYVIPDWLCWFLEKNKKIMRNQYLKMVLLIQLNLLLSTYSALSLIKFLIHYCKYHRTWYKISFVHLIDEFISNHILCFIFLLMDFSLFIGIYFCYSACLTWICTLIYGNINCRGSNRGLH